MGGAKLAEWRPSKRIPGRLFLGKKGDDEMNQELARQTGLMGSAFQPYPMEEMVERGDSDDAELDCSMGRLSGSGRLKLNLLLCTLLGWIIALLR